MDNLKTKTFVIRAVYSDRTKWLYNEAEFSRLLAELVQPAFEFLTTGPKPIVSAALGEPERNTDQTGRGHGCD